MIEVEQITNRGFYLNELDILIMPDMFIMPDMLVMPLFFKFLSIFPRMIFSVIFPGTEVRLSNL